MGTMRIQQIVSPSNDYSNISKLTYFSRNVPSFSSIDGGDNPFLNSVTRIILNIRWLIEKAREFQKNTYLCVINYAKAFDCVDHNKLWKALKRYGNTGPSYMSPEKPVCKSRNNS